MTLRRGDRVKETTATTGTGTYTLAGAATGYQAFSAIPSIIDTDTVEYCATDGTNWEVGLGTYSSGTLARTSIYASSNGGSAVSWAAGSKDIFCDIPARFFNTSATVNKIIAGTSGDTLQTNIATFYSGFNAFQGSHFYGDVTVHSGGPVLIVGDGGITLDEGKLRLYSVGPAMQLTMQLPAAGTDWTWSLPPNAGSSGYLLRTDGAGVTTWVAPPSGNLTVGTTSIASGTTTRVLYDNAGTLGEYTISGSGNVAMTTSPVFTTPNIGSATGSISGNAATVTTNANLTGPITSSGNATSIASQTGTGTKFVVDTSPSILTPTLAGSVNADLNAIVQNTNAAGFSGFNIKNEGGTNKGFLCWANTSATPAAELQFGTSGADPLQLFTNNTNVLTIDSAKLAVFAGFERDAGTSYCTADLAKTSNTTPANITGMSVTLTAGKTYWFEMKLLFSLASSAAGGVKIDLNGGAATATSINGFIYINTSSGSNAANTGISALNTSIGSSAVGTTTGTVLINGNIVVNAGGTFIPTFAQNGSSSNTSTLKFGSFMKVTQLN